MRTSHPSGARSRRSGQHLRRLAASALLVAFSSSLQSQTAILQVRILEGDGAVHAAGSRPGRALLIEVTDETGTPVSGAVASFRLPDEGATGIFPNGLRTEMDVTDAQGHASLRGLQFNHTGGEFQIRITVAKDSARAGTVSTQYINSSKIAIASGKLPKPGSFPSGNALNPSPVIARPVSATPASAGSSHKWLIIGAIAIAAAGGGVAAMGHGSANAKPPATPPSVLTIGAPTISIGRP